MKFNIEIDDFWLDQEEDIEPGLKSFIINTVIKRIYENLEKKVEKTIILEVNKKIEKLWYRKISKFIDEIISNETMPDKVYENSRYVDKEVSIKEYIKNKFKKDTGWSSPNEKIEKLAKSFADELKTRYDLLFASQIVSKLNGNGMLKENVAKLILEDK